MSLFGQDEYTFTSMMLLNIDQLQKQLGNDEFQEDGSIASFWVINRQILQFIDSQFTLDYDSQMTNEYFVEYTRIEVKQFRDTLIQHMDKTQESKIDMGKAVDADLVITKSSGTESEVQDDISRVILSSIHNDEWKSFQSHPQTALRFARFNTIITSLKARDEGFSSKNYVRKFLRALHPKWRAKVMTIKESKDFSSLALDELIDNLKVHEVVMEKDFEIYRGKKERVKSIALKVNKESSDDEILTSESDDETLTSRSNQEKKRSHSDKGMRRKARVTGNALDAVIQIISFAIVQNQLATKIKRLLLEVLEAIAKMTPKTKLTMKLVAWLNQKISAYSKHMTGNKSLFSTYKAYNGSDVVFESNLKGKIIGKEESLNVSFDEIHPPTKLSPLVDDDVGEEEAIRKNTKVVNNNKEDESIKVDEIVNIKESKNHPLDQVMGNLSQRTLRGVELLLGSSNKTNERLNSFNQSKYIKEMLKKFGLEDSKPAKTPMSTEIKLTKDDEADSVDSSKYRGRIVTSSFIAENNMLPFFQAVGLKPFLIINEPICPRFVVEFYHSLKVKTDKEERPYIEFKLDQFTFKLTSSQLS
nr:UBN2 domain-containing protein [Tanacetum cinerariifolium]